VAGVCGIATNIRPYATLVRPIQSIIEYRLWHVAYLYFITCIVLVQTLIFLK